MGLWVNARCHLFLSWMAREPPSCLFVSDQLGIDQPNQLRGTNNFCLGNDIFESESCVDIKNYMWITVIKFLVLESRQSKPKTVCRKEMMGVQKGPALGSLNVDGATWPCLACSGWRG